VEDKVPSSYTGARAAQLNRYVSFSPFDFSINSDIIMA
jgi:hypothetical protein